MNEKVVLKIRIYAVVWMPGVSLQYLKGHIFNTDRLVVGASQEKVSLVKKVLALFQYFFLVNIIFLSTITCL
jgi:hypothetical protein